MQINLLRLFKLVLIGGGYKIYATANGLNIVDNGDGLHTLSDNDDVDSDPYARVKANRFKIVDKFSY